MKKLNLTVVFLLCGGISLFAASGCGDDPKDEPTPDAGISVGPDASAEVPPDASVDEPPDASVEEPPDASVEEPPDASVVVPPEPPAPGELGGECAEGDACDEGECVELPDDRGKYCTEACYDNYGCADHLRCEAVTMWDMYCLFGPRGEGGIGEPCGKDENGEPKKGLGCKSGVCIDEEPEAEIYEDSCTDSCEENSDCSAPFPYCLEWLGACFPIPSGELGGFCRANGTCYDQLECLDIAGVGKRCTAACETDEECGVSYLECKEVGTEKYCLMKQ
jgi:hypothetical protein